MKGRDPVVIGLIIVEFLFEVNEGGYFVILGCEVEGPQPDVILDEEVTPFGNEELDNIHMAIEGCIQQWCKPILVFLIYPLAYFFLPRRIVLPLH